MEFAVCIILNKLFWVSLNILYNTHGSLNSIAYRITLIVPPLFCSWTFTCAGCLNPELREARPRCHLCSSEVPPVCWAFAAIVDCGSGVLLEPVPAPGSVSPTPRSALAGSQHSLGSWETETLTINRNRSRWYRRLLGKQLSKYCTVHSAVMGALCR